MANKVAQNQRDVCDFPILSVDLLMFQAFTWLNFTPKLSIIRKRVLRQHGMNLCSQGDGHIIWGRIAHTSPARR